jgi:hypothetical protein
MPKPNDTADQAARIAELEKALAAAQAVAATAARLSFKVSEKGAVSVYGLGRFPVTLYAGQWDRLSSPDTVAALRSFIADNRGRLATKG